MPGAPPTRGGFIRSHQRWCVVALLFLVAAVNNLDRQALSVLAGTLKTALDFGNVEYSYIVTSFLSAYALGYAFCGTIIDRWGVRSGLGLALLFWSVAGMAHAAAVGWMSLALCRFLLGLGESFNSPGGVKAIAEWVPPRERGLSMAVFSNGNIFGAIVAPPLVSFVALRWGWQWSFIVTGAVGLVLFAVWWRFYETPARHRGVTPEEREYIRGQLASLAPPAPKQSMWALLRHPLCLGFFVARFLTDPTSYFFSFWLPDYLQHSRGFTLALIGLVAWIPFLAADVGGPGGGAMSDWLVRRGWATRRARLTMMAVAAALMPLAAVAVRVEIVWVAIALIALLLAAQSCWMANQLTLISESVPRENVGTLLALTALGGSLGGVVSTLLTGRILDAYGYVPVFTGLGLLHVTAFFVLLWSLRRTRAAGA
ncbi:MAG TPA: MFS transporter [Opitutaceae bacterium]|nr:MFS transporter [Opitutaceae bacterium]